jgi:hypothetical protein
VIGVTLEQAFAGSLSGDIGEIIDPPLADPTFAAYPYTLALASAELAAYVHLHAGIYAHSHPLTDPGVWYDLNGIEITDEALLAYLDGVVATEGLGSAYGVTVYYVLQEACALGVVVSGYGAYGFNEVGDDGHTVVSCGMSGAITESWELGYRNVHLGRRWEASPPDGRQHMHPTDCSMDDVWYVGEGTQVHAKIGDAQSNEDVDLGTPSTVLNPDLTMSFYAAGGAHGYALTGGYLGTIYGIGINSDLDGYDEIDPDGNFEAVGYNGGLNINQIVAVPVGDPFEFSGAVGLAFDYEYVVQNHETLTEAEDGGTHFDQREFDPWVGDSFEWPPGGGYGDHTPRFFRLHSLPARCESEYKSWEDPAVRLKQDRIFAPAIDATLAMDPDEMSYVFEGDSDPAAEELPEEDLYVCPHPGGVSDGTDGDPYHVVGTIERAATVDLQPRTGNAWAGSGAITLVGDTFQIPATTGETDLIYYAPRTRYWQRLDLCKVYGNQHNFQHRFYLTAQDEDEGDAVEIAEGITSQEDPYCYKAFGFLKLVVTKTDAWTGPITLRIVYEDVPVILDPHTTSDEERTAGYSYQRAAQQVATFTTDLVAGTTNTIVFRLMAPDGEAGSIVTPREPHLFIVDELSLTGFEPDGDVTLRIDTIGLTEDLGYDHTGRDTSDESTWRQGSIETFNFQGDWRGLNIIWDGNPHVCKFPDEPSVGPKQGVGYIEHLVDSSEAGVQLDFARDLTFLGIAPGLVEGITITLDEVALADWLQDDSTPPRMLFTPKLYNLANNCWFDTEQCTVASDGGPNTIPLYASAIVRSWTGVKGIHYAAWVTKHTSGVVQCLLRDAATGWPIDPDTDLSAYVEVVLCRYSYYDADRQVIAAPSGWPEGDVWTFVASTGVAVTRHSVWQSTAGPAHKIMIDADGRYVIITTESQLWSGDNWEGYDPATEHDAMLADPQCQGRVWIEGHRPRIYSWGLAEIAGIAVPAALTWPHQTTCLFTCTSEVISCRRALGVAGPDTDALAFGSPAAVAIGEWPSAALLPTGEALLVFARGEALLLLHSRDTGVTWDGEETLVEGYDCPQVLEHDHTGEVFLGAYKIATEQHVILRFVPRTLLGTWEGDEDAYGQRTDALAEIALGIGTQMPGTWVGVAPTGRLRYIYPSDSGLMEALSDDYGRTWAVGSVS